jgi:type VI secretion system secreted protein VgrG
MRVRIESLSNVRTLAPARRFKPYDVANPSNTFEEHVILEIIHTASDRSYETNAGDPEYSNSFIAIPSGVPATPHRTTPRPRIDGTQIAPVPKARKSTRTNMAASSSGSTSGRLTA